MKALRSTLLSLTLALSPALHAAERLVYAVTSPSGSGDATEIFAIGPGDAQPVRIFSDASLPVALAFRPQSANGAPFQTAIIHDRLFSPGKERAIQDSRRAMGIYEFALNNTGQARKIFDLPAGERIDVLAVTSDGAKLGYVSLSAASLTLFIHEVSTGKLLNKVDLTKPAGGCHLANAGWLPDIHTDRKSTRLNSSH